MIRFTRNGTGWRCPEDQVGPTALVVWDYGVRLQTKPYILEIINRRRTNRFEFAIFDADVYPNGRIYE